MRYVAYYEDREKCLPLLQNDSEESDFDLIQTAKYRTAKKFATLDDAVAFGSKAVADELTVFGNATVREIEDIPLSKRCRYCDCAGWQVVRYHNLDETGIIESFDEESPCCD